MKWRAAAYTTLLVAGVSTGAFLADRPEPVSAHFVDRSWVYPVNHYLIDIGYDTDAFMSGEPVRFDFTLKDETATKRIIVPEVWLRISKNEAGTKLAVGIHGNPTGPTALQYVFQEAGRYTLEASYRDAAGEDIATTSFEVSVSPGPSRWDNWDFFIPLGIWLLVFLYWSRRKWRRLLRLG